MQQENSDRKNSKQKNSELLFRIGLGSGLTGGFFFFANLFNTEFFYYLGLIPMQSNLDQRLLVTSLAETVYSTEVSFLYAGILMALSVGFTIYYRLSKNGDHHRVGAFVTLVFALIFGALGGIQMVAYWFGIGNRLEWQQTALVFSGFLDRTFKISLTQFTDIQRASLFVSALIIALAWTYSRDISPRLRRPSPDEKAK